MTVAESATQISVNAKKCSGCRMCELVCSFVHEREVNPRRARIRVLLDERGGVYAPLVCNQCKVCIPTCNRDALYWDEAAAVVRVNAKKCNACGICVDVCEQGAILVDPLVERVNICDKCNGDPECIKWCNEGVLTYVDAAALKIGSEAHAG